MHAVEQSGRRCVTHFADHAGIGASGDALDETGVDLPGARWPRRAGRRESCAAGNDGA